MKIYSIISGRIFLALLLIIVVSSSAEKVGKLFYSGSPEDFKDSSMGVPKDIVALSDEVYIGSPDTLLVKSSASSLFFIIDNSGSMSNYYSKITPVDSTKMDQTSDKWIHSVTHAKDPNGNRFNVVQDLLDTLSDESRFAGVEVGVAVFQSRLAFHDTLPYTDTLKDYEQSGAYLPLMKLSEEYDGKKGRSILKEYLECDYTEYSESFMAGEGTYWWTSGTEVVSANIASLKAPLFVDSAGDTVNTGTNINISLLALKEAMKKSSYTKENQYCIFLSDGEANAWYPETTDTAFINYDSIPTTFTVFFSDSGEVPQTLTKFNDNVKSQDYFSKSNKNSALWAYENTSHEELMKFLMENVISLFDQKFFTTPVGIVVNGYQHTVQWDGTKLILSDLIPIVSDTTSMSYDLALLKVHDSLTLEGDTLLVEEEDTLSFSYEVIIDSSLQYIDSTYTVEYWDRTMRVTEGGSTLTEITSDDQKLEIEFSFDPLEAEYIYTNCAITVRNNKSDAEGDTETITLTKVDGENRFTAELFYELLSGDAQVDNGIIQLGNSDTLTFTFQNSEAVQLPLDVLVYSIPVDIKKNEVSMQKAAYFDQDADGYVDLLRLYYAGNSFEEESDDIFSTVELPASVTIDQIDINDKTVDFQLSYTGSGFKTSVDSLDVVTLADTVDTEEGTLLLPFSLAIADSMAPVITKASLVDSIVDGNRDELTVHFSEPVALISQGEPFAFIAGIDGNKFSAVVSEMSSEDTMGIFEVESVIDNEAVVPGDSITISTESSSTVSDRLNNEQDNAQNRVVEIEVTQIYEYITITEATYFDTDANGYVDRLRFRYEGIEFGSEVDEIISKIGLPTNVTSSGFDIQSGVVDIELSYTGSDFKTSVDSLDVLTLTDTTETDNGLLFVPFDLTITDSMAPVITKASLVDSMIVSHRDELTVHFSESVKEISQGAPFLFRTAVDSDIFTAYVVEMKNDDSIVLFEVETVFDRETIEPGDSIQIATNDSSKVSDYEGNIQTNTNNRVVEIDVTQIFEYITVTGASYFDSDANGFVDSLTIVLEGDYLSGNESSIFDALTIAEERGIQVADKELSGNRFLITLEEDKLKTIVTEEDKILVKDAVTLPNGAVLSACSLQIDDSIAPVIVGASLVDSAKADSEDLLTVTFSEAIKESDEQEPFLGICQSTDDQFRMQLKIKELDGTRVTYLVEKLLDKTHVYAGDSLYIRSAASDPTEDIFGNVQSNPLNLRQPIEVTFVAEPLSFELYSTLWTEEGSVISGDILTLNGFDEIKGDLTVDGSGLCKESMIIVVQPEPKENLYSTDSLAGVIRIIDQVGNVVVETLPLIFDRANSQLITVWNGRNKLQRLVGAGTYLALTEISVYRPAFSGSQPVQEAFIKEPIGVKATKALDISE